MDSYLTAEISAGALRHNLQLLRERIGPTVQLCACVKADCYGHGLRVSLPVISEEADWLAVATPEEALLLRHLEYSGNVLVFFSPCAWPSDSEIVENLCELILGDISLTVTTTKGVALIATAAQKVGRSAKIHVKMDTGMGRSGVPAKQAADIIEAVTGNSELRLEGICTHFASADEADKSFTKSQLDKLLAFCRHMKISPAVLRHAANSAATIDLPQTHLDMVRPGIAIYGYQPSNEMLNALPLQPCLRLVGRLMQVKHVPAGMTCGYGRTYTFKRDSVIGLAPVGYGDGYFRWFSNRATMCVRGHDVPVRGRVSMDQTILDLTDVPGATVGDEVEIISSRPNDPHSVENLARIADTIPYEITCAIGQRARRVLVG